MGVNWVEIVLFILKIILGGASKKEAVQKASSHFRVSESEIWNHGGF